MQLGQRLQAALVREIGAEKDQVGLTLDGETEPLLGRESGCEGEVVEVQAQLLDDPVCVCVAVYDKNVSHGCCLV